MKQLNYLIKPALFIISLMGFFAAANGVWAADATPAAAATNTVGVNAKYTYSTSALTQLSLVDSGGSGDKVLMQVYNLIRFAYIFFYAIAVLLIAQAWLQFKQQKYDVMFASMGAALGLFLTPAIVDFLHGLGEATGK